ncbi:MAG: YscO family type III secretion system apparatus protein [Kiritimatiellae bacterium]|nr:YscO family type III secretion system apparatus protein [Kiritimatiellia bacterium]
MAYALQPLLKIRTMREDRASGELVAAKRKLAIAEEALDERRRDYSEWESTKEARRDRIYDAIIGREVSRDQLDLANEGVTRIDEEGALKADNVKRAEGEVREKALAADAARANLVTATKNRMKIDEHRAVWLKEAADEQEARAEGELEDFIVRKEEI